MRNISILLCAIIILTAASLFFLSNTSASIGDILNSPEQYDGKTVWVKGIVHNPVNVGNVGGYFLVENTKSIPVSMSGIPPKEGTIVKLEARVAHSQSLGWHLQSGAMEIAK